MPTREGSWWSRAWGAVALTAFAVHFGASIYEVAVVAPLWIVDPPKSIAAWNALQIKPDASMLFQALVATIVVSTSIAWMSGIATKGWRRWWLTLALVAAAALASVTVLLVVPSERWLFGAGALGGNDASIVAWTGDWMRAAAFRLAALVVGTWCAYRAQMTVSLAEYSLVSDELVSSLATPGRGRRVREFVFGDERDPEVTFGDEAENPRQRWRDSLPGRSRTAKK